MVDEYNSILIELISWSSGCVVVGYDLLHIPDVWENVSCELQDAPQNAHHQEEEGRARPGTRVNEPPECRGQ